MSLLVRLSPCGYPELWADEQLIVSRLDVEIPAPQLESDPKDALKVSPWVSIDESGDGNVSQGLRRVLRIDGQPLLTAEVRSEGATASFTVTVERTLTDLRVGDTFEAFSVALPRISTSTAYRCFLTTYGLGPSGNGGVGGYWPEALVADSTRELPSKAFTPLVLFDRSSALAIAPSSQFLTSSLVADHGDVVRTLHGSIDTIEAGTRIETLFAWGKDVTEALLHVGDVLLDRGGKSRLDPHTCTVTSKLGWWNAYGGYYTEPIHPLDAPALSNLVKSLRTQGVPVEYLGLDLWYPYKFIGQALRFAPDPAKYPDGVGSVVRKYHLPLVLHLSALFEKNDYRADGSSPAYYRQVAEELRSQGALVAWHDWLRTQQHLTPKLRSDTVAADRWFAGMSDAMAEQGIRVMTCMQTMGMVLGSTALPNIIAARSSIDYLFAQPQALDTLERLGLGEFRNEETPLHVMRRQNLLVGFTYYAMGLLPFYDLFLTRWHNDVGGLSPRSEAILRALSCGPVGIGDGPGMTDMDVVATLLSATGSVLQPDHPPYPDTETLGRPIEVYRTERRTREARWEYVLALNTTNEEQTFDLPADSGDAVTWNVLSRSIVDRAHGTLASGELGCFVQVPCIEGIAPLGLWEKAVPAPSHVLLDAEWKDGWTIRLDAPGETFAVWTSEPIRICNQEGNDLSTHRQGALVLCPIGEGVTSLHIARR